MYEYRVEAVDSSGFRSPAKLTVQARPFDTGVRTPVKELTAIFNQKDNSVSLSWVYTPPKTESAYFVVYRSRNGAPVSRYRSVDSGQKSFVDHEVTGPAVYEYAVKLMTQSGAESPLSERIRVQVHQQTR
jgi:hypothetical protein